MPSQEFKIEDGKAVALTIEETLLLEWAKELFTKSVTVALEYCKNMSAASVAAIPLYYGLFAFIVPDDWIASSLGMKALVGIPALLFLIASAVFALGAMPKDTEIQLDTLTRAANDKSGTSVEAVRGTVLNNVKFKAWTGTGIFAAGIIVSAIVVGAVAFDQSRPKEDEAQQAYVVSESRGVVCGKLVAGKDTQPVMIGPASGDSAFALDDVTEVHMVDSCP